MKKIIYIFIIYLLSLNTAEAQSGWYTQLITPDQMRDIFFIDENTGWAVGDNGIRKTTNGGINWQVFSGWINNFLASVYFINHDIGWVVGANNPINNPLILHTTNGGQNWYVQDCQYTLYMLLFSIFFIDQNTGWTLGIDGPIFKTTNGGINWIIQLNVKDNLRSIYFINQNTGWVGGDDSTWNGLIMKTINGGSNWSIQYYDIYSSLSSVYFVNSVTGWSVGTTVSLGGIVLKTTNGGINWFTQFLSYENNYLNSVQFINQDTGWVVGYDDHYTYEGTIMKTTNGGTNWFYQPSNTFFILNSLYFIDDKTGWIVGGSFVDTGGIVLKTTDSGGPIGITPISSSIPKTFSLSQNYPNPFNPSTKIKFEIPMSPLSERGVGGFITLKIYDILGREITTLVNEPLQPGTYEVEWDSANYSSGVYFYRLSAGNFQQTRKMVLIK